ncbi:MAG: hypothetical protein MK120_05660 [Puniceicoccaceae bacterium]|nr:hypothetical protein [Puniceicoccaceae bacterium]
MKVFKKILFLSIITALLISSFTACSSTRSENGVIIQEERNWNPIQYIPFL